MSRKVLSRPPSRELGLIRRLSVEEKYIIAETARRKSNCEASKGDLRLLIGHSNVLGRLLKDVELSEYEQALKTPPPSPTEKPRELHITWADATGPTPDVEELDDGAEDLEELSLVRTVTRRR